jgi:hypothetical protein
MSGREEPAARNESISRGINERIEEAHDRESPAEYVRMVCECGQETCDRLIAISAAEYEQIRSDPRQFAVTREHVIADLERVVYETDRFAVVTKEEGTPAEVATEEDPRS